MSRSPLHALHISLHPDHLEVLYADMNSVVPISVSAEDANVDISPVPVASILVGLPV